MSMKCLFEQISTLLIKVLKMQGKGETCTLPSVQGTRRPLIVVGRLVKEYI